MNAKPCIIQGSDHIIGYACQCGSFFSAKQWPEDSLRMATNCCGCSDCGGKVFRYGKCKQCRDIADARIRSDLDEKERQREADAPRVLWQDYGGYLWVSDTCCTDDLLHAQEEIVNDDAELPTELWEAVSFDLQISAEDIVENALQQHHEDAEVGDEMITELQGFLDGWCKRTGIASFEQGKRRVVLPEWRKR